jgi:hypothetical protein
MPKVTKVDLLTNQLLGVTFLIPVYGLRKSLSGALDCHQSQWPIILPP